MRKSDKAATEGDLGNRQRRLHQELMCMMEGQIHIVLSRRHPEMLVEGPLECAARLSGLLGEHVQRDRFLQVSLHACNCRPNDLIIARRAWLRLIAPTDPRGQQVLRY